LCTGGKRPAAEGSTSSIHLPGKTFIPSPRKEAKDWRVTVRNRPVALYYGPFSRAFVHEATTEVRGTYVPPTLDPNYIARTIRPGRAEQELFYVRRAGTGPRTGTIPFGNLEQGRRSRAHKREFYYTLKKQIQGVFFLAIFSSIESLCSLPSSSRRYRSSPEMAYFTGAFTVTLTCLSRRWVRVRLAI
jgi:hypothetical protein